MHAAQGQARPKPADEHAGARARTSVITKDLIAIAGGAPARPPGCRRRLTPSAAGVVDRLNLPRAARPELSAEPKNGGVLSRIGCTSGTRVFCSWPIRPRRRRWTVASRTPISQSSEATHRNWRTWPSETDVHEATVHHTEGCAVPVGPPCPPPASHASHVDRAHGGRRVMAKPACRR